MQRSLAFRALDHFGLSEVVIGDDQGQRLVEPLPLRPHRELAM